jgi:hypothetical protein
MKGADEEHVARVWDQFRWSVQALAADDDVQKSLFPDFTCKPYELASDFDNWFGVAKGYFAAEFTNERLETLHAIGQMLGDMSLNGRRFAEALWWDEALSVRPEWAEVRLLAKHALELFGWQIEAPPPGRSFYARGP